MGSVPLRLELEDGEGVTFADAVAAASREHRIVSTALVVVTVR